MYGIKTSLTHYYWHFALSVNTPPKDTRQHSPSLLCVLSRGKQKEKDCNSLNGDLFSPQKYFQAKTLVVIPKVL